MTIPASGPVSMADIIAEHGGSASNVLISNYYRGLANHLIHPNNTAIPASGQISLSTFRGTSRFGYYPMVSETFVNGSGTQYGFNSGSFGSLTYNIKYRGYNIQYIIWNGYDNLFGIALAGTNIPQATIASLYSVQTGTITFTNYNPSYLGAFTVWTVVIATNPVPTGNRELIIL